MNRSLRCAGISILFVVWCALALIPFLSTNLDAFLPLLDALRSCLIAAWFWIFAAALGWKISHVFQLFKVQRDSLVRSLQSLLLSLGLGLGFLAFITLLTGLIHVSPWIFFVLFCVLTVGIGSTWRDFFHALLELGQLIQQTDLRKRLLYFGCCGALALFMLPWALTPTLFPDTLRYHFGLTRVFEQAGRIRFISDYAEAGLASNWQMLFLPQLLLSGESVAMIFNWIALPLIALTVAVATPREGRWIAALTLISTPFLLEVSTLGNNDLGVAFFSALACLALRNSSGRAPFFLGGVFAGLAVGTKYTALAPMLVLLSVFAFFHERDRTSNFLWAFIGLSLGYFPWFVRNVIWTGDPFYPALSDWLPWAKTEGQWVAQHYRMEMANYGSPKAWPLRTLLAPWEATVADPRFGHESDPGVLFWCVAPCLGVLAWLRKQNRPLIIFVIVSIAAGWVWSMGAHVTRFLAPLIPIFAIAVGEGWNEWMTTQPSARTRSLVTGIILLLAGINFWQALTSLSGFAQPYSYLLGGMTRENYLRQQSPSYRAADWLGQAGRVQDRVLLLGEENFFFFKNPIRMSGSFDRKWIVSESERSRDADDLAQRLRSEGIVYICINPLHAGGMDRRFGYLSWPSPGARERFESLLKNETDPLRSDQGVEIYRVRSAAPRIAPKLR